jgi:hypothetical protein
MGLPAPLTIWRLVAERVGHAIHFVWQRLQHARAVLQFHLALQQHELRDFLQSILPGRRGHTGEELGTRRESVEVRCRPAKTDTTQNSNVRPGKVVTTDPN